MDAGARARIDDDPAVAAAVAGLRYVRDDRPGLTRRRRGRGFVYADADGARITDAGVLARLRALAIPPAWTDVWICPSPLGHIQATGRDARGRKQYRYHAEFRAIRDATKYHRLAAFARALPRIRARLDADLRRRGTPKPKVIAAVVALLERTRIRVGNDEYVRDNGTYGLTTLRTGHAAVARGQIRFRFKGKSAVRHDVTVDDARLARIVRDCQELPGKELFQYVDRDGAAQPIDSADVNAYIRAAAGTEFSAKDFRTWAGTVITARRLCAEQLPARPSQRAIKACVVAAIKATADELRNRPATCRRYYIHPAVLEAFERGTLRAALGGRAHPIGELSAEESAVLRLIEAAA
jgi:DNA topoisomerase-1